MIETMPYAVAPPTQHHHRSRVPLAVVVSIVVALTSATLAIAIPLANNNGSSPSTSPSAPTASPATPNGGTGGNSASTPTDTSPTSPSQPSTSPGTGGNSTSTPGGTNSGAGSNDDPSGTAEQRADEARRRAQEEAARKTPGEGSQEESISDSTVIKDSNPTIGITHLGDVKYVIAKSIYDFFYGAVNALMSICGFVMSIMDSAMDPLLTSSFSGGAFDRLYVVANQVSTTVGVPFGTAICGISFMVAMVENSERHRRFEARSGVFDTLMLVLGLAVGLTLIYHAVDLCALIYLLATNAVRLLQQALASVGVASVGSSVSDTLQLSVMGSMDQLTFGEVGMSLVYVIVALTMAVMCFGVMTHVILQGLLRMGEVYLRAAFSPIAIGFGAARSTRPMAIAYAKRFAAVALNAALIILALALSGLLFSVAADVISPLVSSTSTGAQALIGGLVPTVVAITAVSALVKKGEQISQSLFGLS